MSGPPDAALLHREFEAQARRTPQQTALEHQGASISFAELNDRADRLADLLRGEGLENGFVGLHVERSIDYVVAVLAILKANAAVVPLPPSYPVERLRAILEFAKLDAVVVSEASRIDASFGTRLIHAASGESQPSHASNSNTADVRPSAPAFVLSSSGSTGHPKLIVRSHESFFHRLRWTWEQHPFGAGEACVQKSHMTTTHAIYELFEPLLRGVPVHIVSDDDVRQLATFWDAVHRHRVSRLLLVPSMLRASLDIPSFKAPDIRVLVLMGEYVPAALAARALEAFPRSTSIYSIYGSTEASSTFVCDLRVSTRPGAELPLGAPISASVEALVLDDALQPVPSGGEGMLYIGGSALFSAYHRDPTLTAAAQADHDGRRAYRTQDRVRLLPDGALEFVGRVDDTVKIRGFRIELREVERAIAANDGVRQAVVLAHESGSGTSLVGFVSPASVDVGAVLSSTRESLPAYMVPASVVALDTIPVTPSGKIDRRALLAMYAARGVDAGESFASETERTVAKVWHAVLGHAGFGRDSNFFEIGGSSLEVFAVVFRVAEQLSLPDGALTELAVYRNPVLAALAARIDAIREGRAVDTRVADDLLVTLRSSGEPQTDPLFVIASAGGTLGAYTKLVAALRAKREVIGVRDPFLWGDRDATLGFDHWVARYVAAMVARQPRGAFYIAAYSSAGAFGYEIARRLRAAARDVALLALIDPLALDRGSKRRFGYWALEARFKRRQVAWALRAMRVPRRVFRGLIRRGAHESNGLEMTNEEFERFADGARRNTGYIRGLSALLELNTDRRFSLDAAEVERAGPDGCLQLLLDRVRAVSPETDPKMIEKLVVQYELQVRSQHAYRLQPYDGDVQLFEPEGPFRGMEAAQLAPYVGSLRSVGLPVGAASGPSVLDGIFPDRIRDHYLSMRDDAFVAGLARELDRLLDSRR